MSRKYDPMFTSIEGVDVAILPREAYDLLSGQRRQLGALSSQLHPLKQALSDATALLDEIEDALSLLPSPDAENTNSQESLETLVRLLKGRSARLRRST